MIGHDNMRKIVCIDYDGTYTAMPDLLTTIVNKSKDLGYLVILATMRYEHEMEKELEILISIVDRVIFTGRKAKQPYLLAMGIEPTIWIDDQPRWLLHDDTNIYY